MKSEVTMNWAYWPNGKMKNECRIFIRNRNLYGTVTPSYAFETQIFNMERERVVSGSFAVMSLNLRELLSGKYFISSSVF
jgi:hypothetical protein